MSSKLPPLKPGDVLPGHVLRDEHGFNADHRPAIVVDAAEVPEDLKPLIPHVERWAIPCDVTRGDVFQQEGSEAVASFYEEVNPHLAAVNGWLDSQPANVEDWPDAAVHFMYLLKAHSEAWQPTPEEQDAIDARLEARAAEVHRARSLEQALPAFGAREYEQVVQLLSPYEDSLTGSTAAKLRIARKKLSKG